MNLQLLRSYISEYEKNFAQIDRKEIYKWQAVKQFQDSWNPDASNFATMLEHSLSRTYNLLAANQYWPERMIIHNATTDPKKVRGLFLDLFDEEKDVLARISDFQRDIREINSLAFPGKKDYQDHRAILVYLNLRYPDNYFLYKFGMLKTFCVKLEHDYKPTNGAIENVAEYFYLCNIICDEIQRRNNLLKLHKDRIGEKEYFDTEYHILTQDFVYAVANYLSLEEVIPIVKPRLNLVNFVFDIEKKQHQFKGRFVDYVAQHKRNKHIGYIGEEIVRLHELANCPPAYIEKIVHSPSMEGDGLGFDILSYDENGSKKYIEVKATKGSVNQPFFISGTELERSKVEGKQYFLYRLYNVDEDNMTADCFIIQGDLSKYCINPTEYEVTFTNLNHHASTF